MKNFLLAIMSCIMIVFTLTACSLNTTNIVGQLLQQDELYNQFQTSPTNLSVLSKCGSTPPSVNIVNVETRSENHDVWNSGGASMYIIPNKFIDNVVNYISDALQKSQIKVDGNSTKSIQVSLNEANFLRSVFNYGAELRLKIFIPDKQYTTTFKVEDWTPKGQLVAMAGAIHMVTWIIIKDPTIQEYILCR